MKYIKYMSKYNVLLHLFIDAREMKSLRCADKWCEIKCHISFYHHVGIHVQWCPSIEKKRNRQLF